MFDNKDNHEKFVNIVKELTYDDEKEKKEVSKPSIKNNIESKNLFTNELQIFSHVLNSRGKKIAEEIIAKAISDQGIKVSWGGNPAIIVGFRFKNKKYIIR